MRVASTTIPTIKAPVLTKIYIIFQNIDYIYIKIYDRYGHLKSIFIFSKVLERCAENQNGFPCVISRQRHRGQRCFWC